MSNRGLNGILFQGLAVLTLIILCISTASGESYPVRPDKPHHTGKRFKNPGLIEDRSFFDFLRWRWERLWIDIPPPASYNFPLADNDPEFLKANRDKTTLTWIGHATMLFQVSGLNFLTDPQFSERSSPVQWAGPKRVVPPGIALKDLPHIHGVIISHDHYDSLDKQTVLKLREREGGSDTVFFVPLGLKKWFASLGISNVVELNWWDEHLLGTVRIIAAPMQHWSKRNVFYRNNHLWASFIILSKDFRFYFGGDTGYAAHFQEIGEKFGPIDLSLLPIGAYEPRWFMKRHHINPEEAVQAHIDLRSMKSVGMHWGTFALTDEPLDEPPVRLKNAMKERGIPEDTFLVLKHGETIIIE